MYVLSMSPCSTAEMAACPLYKRIDAADPFVQISLPVMSFYTNLGSYTSNGLGVFSDHRKSLPIGPSCKWGHSTPKTSPSREESSVTPRQLSLLRVYAKRYEVRQWLYGSAGLVIGRLQIRTSSWATLHQGLLSLPSLLGR